MKQATGIPSHKRHRFPPAIIAHAVWPYFCFSLRYRDVAERLAARGVVLTDETVRQWCQKFGQAYANALRRRRPRPGDTWPLDAVFVSSNGQQHSRWRAVDQDGTVRDILVQSRRVDPPTPKGCGIPASHGAASPEDRLTRHPQAFHVSGDPAATEELA